MLSYKATDYAPKQSFPWEKMASPLFPSSRAEELSDSKGRAFPLQSQLLNPNVVTQRSKKLARNSKPPLHSTR